jgi:hypothetical protein
MSDEALTFASTESSRRRFHMENYEDSVGIEVLLEREHRHLRAKIGKTFLEIQNDFGHEHLDQVLDWLCDLCWERSCHPELFTLAALLVDRFLTECQIKVCQLQLLAVSCLILASKIRISKHPDCSIPVSLLVEFADHSFSEDDVKVISLL